MIKTLIFLRIKSMFAGMFSGSRRGKTAGPGRKILMAVLFIYLAACFLGLFGILFSMMCKPFAEAGIGWLYFSIESILIFALCFIGSVFATQTQIFEAKDNELLLAMPVKPSAILGSRIAALLLLNYIYALAVALPAGVIWCMSQPVTVPGVIFYILSVILMPLLALAVSCLFGWIIALVTSRLRKKNIVTLVMSVAFFVAYFWFCGNISRYMQELVMKGEQIAQAIEKSVFPAYHMGKAIAEGNILSMLLFVLCAVIPFAIVYFILSRAFVGIATSNRGAKKIKYREQALKVSGVRAAFRKKELRHYFSNAMYMLNATLGVVFMVIVSVLLVVKEDMIRDAAEQFNLMGADLHMGSLMCVVLTMCAALNFISAPSISLEGKSLWLAQSLPAKGSDILLAKMEAHCAVCLPFAVLAAVVGNIVLKPPVLEAVLMFLVPGVFTVMVGYLGVVVNLKFPRFDWISETHVVKQGMSVMITMFGIMAAVVALAIVYFAVLSKTMSLEVYLVLCGALFLLASVIMHVYLATKGAEKFAEL